MLPKGKFNWYNPAHFLKPGAKSIFNKLGGMKDLPHIPNTVMRLLTMIEVEDFEVKQIAAEVKKEPFIANELFRIATNLRDSRSPGQAPLESLEHAILYVGVPVLKDLVITASLKKFQFKVKSFSTEIFWKEAHLCGYIAERVARQIPFHINPDEAYLAGVLINIGKLVGAICLPDETDQIYMITRDPDIAKSWDKIEQSQALTSHITLGEIGSTIWGFPTYITEAITAHHNHNAVHTQALKMRRPEFYWLTAFANQICHWLLLQPERMNEPLLKATSEKLGLKESDVQLLTEALMPLKDLEAA
jgi:HD-like signal output (HDOD) protein